ncbi:hypothetical protein [Mesorhizobium sp. M0643]|uniref:hypothetical protein n=1 Tax=Mesorhizobium sp. M0643 TaxID=2956978 RepID=UPI003335681E
MTDTMLPEVAIYAVTLAETLSRPYRGLLVHADAVAANIAISGGRHLGHNRIAIETQKTHGCRKHA